MNRKIVLNLFRKMFPTTNVVIINMTDEQLKYDTPAGDATEKLDRSKVESHLSMLKDYLNIKGNINVVTIDFTKKEVKIDHTHGISKL